MIPELKNFIIELGTQTKTHDDWLAVMRFGMLTLLQNQDVLIELISIESARECMRDGRAHLKPSDCIFKILMELEIRFVMGDASKATL